MTIVTFSGIDGSGKTRMARSLAARLRERGHHAIYGRPQYRSNAQVLRYCAHRFGDEYAYFPRLPPDFYISILSLDWLSWHMDVLEAVPDETVVCCDRYVIDVYAQAVQYGARLEPIQEVFRVFRQPDLSVFLETSPADAVRRIRERGDPPPHRLETLENLTALAACYDVAAARLNWPFARLANDGDIEHALARVEDWLSGTLPRPGA